MRRRGMPPKLAALLLLTVVGAATFAAFTKDIPFVNEPYEIRAAFRDTNGMLAGSPVRIAGVEVGEVRDVERTSPRARTAMVTMSIRDRGRPIHRDARAKIRPRIFLEGNFFVDLQPGTPQAGEMEAGGTIPVTRTANPVQLDQVLSALRADTRGHVKDTVGELAETQRAGGAEAFNDSLVDQPGAYRWSAVVAEALLGERPGDLAGAIRDTGVVAGGLDRHPQRLRTLIRDFDRTMAVFADGEEDLRAAVRELPRTLRESMPALADLNEAFPEVRRLASDARPGVRSTGPTADALIPLVRELRGFVGEDELRGLARDLREAVPDVAAMSRATVPLLEQVRPLAQCTTNVLVPFGNSTVPDKAHPASGPVYQEAGKFLPGLAGESRSFDANGQWFKVVGQGGLETLDLGNGLIGTALRPIMGVNPPPDRTLPPYRPETPCETQEPPNLDTKPGLPPKRVDTNPRSRLVQERLENAREVFLGLTQAILRRNGEDAAVVDRDTTLEQILDLATRNGLVEQLQEVARRR